MNQKVGQSGQHEMLGLETGLEALRRSSEFRGPVEPLDVHDHDHEGANDHFASIYEGRGEQFATAIPFVRQGLDRGEQCLYVADDSSREEVLEAMRSRGIDVDAALESGALSVLTKEETYLETGEFDRDAMLEFWEEALERARDEDGYAGIRAAAEMTWALDGETNLDRVVEYEAMLNDLYEDEDYVVLCQYNRERFPAAVVRDVIRTHPHLIQRDEVYHNVYYTPPEEYFGPDRPDREVDRMMGTLRERTEVKTELKENQQYLQTLYDIAADADVTFEEKLQALFDLGCERFDLELGGIARIDPETDMFEVETISGEHDYLVPGAQVELSETYCRVFTDDTEVTSITEPLDSGFEDTLAYEKFGVRTYLGTRLELDKDLDRTFFFVSSEPRDEEFSDAERTFHHLMGQWVKYELERQQRERELRERTEHLSALVETTPECIKTVAEDGTLLQMNSAGLEMVEADSESDVIGECVYDLIAPEHREKFREFNERICRGESGTLEFDIIGMDGTRRHMESHAAPLHRPDGTTAHVALTRDVTERKEREHELKRVERQFEAAFNNPSSFMGLLDPDGTVRRINETALEFAGVDESEVRGAKFWETPWFTHSEEVQENLQAGIERAADGEYVRSEIPHRSPEGDTIIMDAMFEPVYDENGEVVAIVPSGYDITERKKHEERLEQKNDRLESFASMLAHELRNPVTIGQIYSQQLPAETDARADGSRSEAVEYVTEAFDRIEDMIDVMLVLTRGREAVGERTRVNLAALTREAWDEVDTPDATLDVALDRTIQADETYVRHLFRNLLENAVEHGEKDDGGGVSVTVGELPAGFYVADDGPGIPPEERDNVFEAGYTTASDGGGTGLGLAFVRELAEVYEWDCDVTESDAGGARFEFRNVDCDSAEN